MDFHPKLVIKYPHNAGDMQAPKKGLATTIPKDLPRFSLLIAKIIIAIEETLQNAIPIPWIALDIKNKSAELIKQGIIKPVKNNESPPIIDFLHPYLLEICPAGMVKMQEKSEYTVKIQF